VTLDHVTGNGGTGRFFRSDYFKSVTIRNCTLNKTAGIYLNAPQSGASIVVTRNRQSNVQPLSIKTQFVQLDHVTTATIDISWNEVVNAFGQSGVEDNISLYATAYAKVHDNYIQGAYPSSATGGFSGSGIMSGEQRGHDNEIYNNQIVDTITGIGIAGGSNNSVHDNRLVFDGRLPDGTVLTAANVGIFVWNMDNDPSWSNNQAYGNTIAWMYWNGSSLVRNDTWLPHCTGNCSNTSLITVSITDETAELARWHNKLAAAGITVGA
jgi:hypothetical protein